MGSMYLERPRLRATAQQRLCCFVFSVVAAIGARDWRLVLAAGLALALAAALYPEGLAALRSRQFWAFLVLVLVPTCLLGDAPYWGLAGLAVSQPGLQAGLQMALRALIILVTARGFACTVSISQLAGVFQKAGLQGLGFALGVAFNLLPTLHYSARASLQALWLRGGFRRNRLQAVRLLLVTVVVNSLRQAEEVVSAAEARAFSAEGLARAAPAVRAEPGGLAAGGVLAALTIALLWS